MKLVYISDAEGEDDAVVYIDGKYIIGEYYACYEAAVAVARFFNPNIEIESWKAPRDEEGCTIEFPLVLPEDYETLWDLSPV